MKDFFLGKLWSTHQRRCWPFCPGKLRQELGFPASGSSTCRGEWCQVWDRSCLRCCLVKVEEKWITCEIVHPAAEVSLPRATGWMKTARRVVANRATSCAPFECPGGLGCQISPLSWVFFSFFGQQKIRVAVLGVPRAVATRAK